MKVTTYAVRREAKSTIFKPVFSELIQGFSKREKVDQPEKVQRPRLIDSEQALKRE